MQVRKQPTSREQPPEGVHLARIVGLTNLGHQPGFTWAGGEAEDAFKFEITYELVATKMKDDRNFWVSEEVTNTDNEKGKLRHRIVSTGSNFDNIEGLVGKPVMVTLEMNAKGYPKVTNVAGVPSGLPVPSLENETQIFDIYASPSQKDLFLSFPEFKQNKIRSALDFNETQLSKDL
jgi:hypothetical protein